jgi:hypothetical protein
MKLPNGEKAKLGDKLEQYTLNVLHSRGKDKAAMFKNRLGITLENQEILAAALLKSALEGEAVIHKIDQYGVPYDVKFVMETESGTSLVVGCWIIRSGEDFPRLTNTYYLSTPVDK